MVTIRNWRDAPPVVEHGSALRWVILKQRGVEECPREYAPLQTIGGIALQLLQSGTEGRYHSHDDCEQVYYFTRGRARMKLEDKLHDVKNGDAIHVPLGSKHQLINDGPDWVEYLILDAPGSVGETNATIRNWRDCAPVVGHESAIIWSIFRGLGAPGASSEQARLFGLTGFTLHLMQGRRDGDYHAHEDAEQLYYFTRGQGKMKIDGAVYPVTEGDAVHVPAQIQHQLLNTSNDWIEHLIVTAKINYR